MTKVPNPVGGEPVSDLPFDPGANRPQAER